MKALVQTPPVMQEYTQTAAAALGWLLVGYDEGLQLFRSPPGLLRLEGVGHRQNFRTLKFPGEALRR